MPRAVKAWTPKTDDAAIPPRVKLRIYDRCGGRCLECKRPVGKGLAFAYDHIIALINGGRHAEDNLQILCETCHGAKTQADVATKSKLADIRKREIGAKPKGRGWRKAPPGYKFSWATMRMERVG